MPQKSTGVASSPTSVYRYVLRVLAAVTVALASAVPLAAAKGPCTDYFGHDVDSNATTGTLWTVADVDVHAGFPFGNETFIHHSGPHSACHSPGPPAGCQCATLPLASAPTAA
jgi:hypothetical protein